LKTRQTVYKTAEETCILSCGFKKPIMHPFEATTGQHSKHILHARQLSLVYMPVCLAKISAYTQSIHSMLTSCMTAIVLWQDMLMQVGIPFTTQHQKKHVYGHQRACRVMATLAINEDTQGKKKHVRQNFPSDRPGIEPPRDTCSSALSQKCEPLRTSLDCEQTHRHRHSLPNCKRVGTCSKVVFAQGIMRKGGFSHASAC